MNDNKTDMPGVRRICSACDALAEENDTSPSCVKCGGKMIEIRPHADPLIGQVIDGRFEIRGRLGAGGMGTVYRAWQRSVAREVAIKIMSPQYASDPMSVRRFLREARLASQLSQPNTVSVIDFGQAEGGQLFIAMELVRGKTIADVLEQQGPMTVGRAARLGVQICDALDAAHRLGIVHRDLKPANIVVLDDPPGRDLLKVLDFGLAKSLTEIETGTQIGHIVGTPQYMSPEVLEGGKPSVTSDLYAVGTMLIQLTTGTLPWKGDSTDSLHAQKIMEPPQTDKVPQLMRPLCDRLIAVNPGARPQSATEVRSMLYAMCDSADRAVIAGGPVDAVQATVIPPMPAPHETPTKNELPGGKAPPPPPPPQSTSLSPMLAAAAAVAIVLAVGAVKMFARPDATETVSTVVADAGNAVAAVVEVRPQVAVVTPDAGAALAEPVFVIVHVSSAPSGARLWVDGENVGLAPMDLRIRSGVPTVVKASLKGKAVARTVELTANDSLHLVLPAASATTQKQDQGALPF